MEPEFMEVLIFEVAGQRHGLPVADVQELLPALSIMPLPGAPSGVEGVINLRGTIVPVLDVRQSFGVAPKVLALADHFIVIRSKDRPLALRVDRAVELARVDAAAVSQVDAPSPGREHSARVAKIGDGMVILHQVHDLLATAGAPRTWTGINSGLPLPEALA